MSLFDTLIDSVLEARPALSVLKPVVEKEILHQDILREMSDAGLLGSLTFIGGTCLRTFYGSDRLSEDLDFTGGENFTKDTLSGLSDAIVTGLHKKYSLRVSVSEPVRESGNVDTWKIKIITHPGNSHLPAQRIHIDVCSVPSHQRKPSMLINHYPVDMGTSGLILYAETKNEILADKILAVAERPDRVKNRDLWDILWFFRQGVHLDTNLFLQKLDDRKINKHIFMQNFRNRIEGLKTGFPDYTYEMRRFLPGTAVHDHINQPGYWDVMLSTLDSMYTSLQKSN